MPAFDDAHVIGATIAAAVATLTFAANVALQEMARYRERQAVIAAFRSDIRSIVSVLDRMGLVDAFVACLHAKDCIPHVSSWIDAPREEDYFQLFGAMASKIGLTPLPLAREIVKFYTFLRASRDAARPLGPLKAQPLQERKHVEHARNVLVALGEVFRAADDVLDAKFSPSKQNDGQDVARRLRECIDAALPAKPA